VFPARYELNSYIVFRKRLVSKRLKKVAIFWDTAPCNQNMNRRFGGTYHLHLQGRKSVEKETNVSAWPPACSAHFHPPEYGGDMFL
jgi:hypothetical protein